jgi:hypothetical protein
MRVFALMLVLSCLAISISFSEDVSVRAADTTVINFDQQIQEFRTQKGFNANASIRNFEDHGLLIITTRETFASDTLHVILQDGSVKSLTLVADPTASLQTSVASASTNSKLTGATQNKPNDPSKSSSQSTSMFRLPANAPEESVQLLSFIASLERATAMRLRYTRVLPAGVSAMVTRLLEENGRLMYELEVINNSTQAVSLTAESFAHGLTEAVYVLNMDQFGTRILEPGDATVVYISDFTSM